MSVAALARLADGLWLLAGGLSLVLAGRLGYAAVTIPRASSETASTRATAQPARHAPSRPSVAPAGRKPARAAPGALVTTQIVVEGTGLGRAAVRVDGTAVGQTPYIGDVTCRVGEPVQVEIVGSSDERRSYAVPCRDDVLRLPEGDTR